MNQPIEVPTEQRERALLIGVLQKGETREWLNETLDEMVLLADTAGADVVDRMIQERSTPVAATFIGKGFAEQIGERLKADAIPLVLFDDDLTPAQVKNLEAMWENARIVDRTGLILDIFAKRARTREAVIAVELAQLEYLLPRLSGRWAHLERQRGGIGMRGPGETQLETDRRIIREKIGQLKTMLGYVEQQCATRRSNRASSYKVAIAGYTNAGKSTLFKALTGGEPFIENRLFATLDPLVRPLRLPNSSTPALLTDTVGFIRKLPHSLIASFRSTLAETVESELVLHVVDISHKVWRQQYEDVNAVLKEIGAEAVPQLLVFNKVDQLTDDSILQELSSEFPEALFVSALRGHRLWELKQKIGDLRTAGWNGAEITMTPEGAGQGLAAIYAQGEVIEQESFDDGRLRVKYRVPIQYQRHLEAVLMPLQWKPPVKMRALPEGVTIPDPEDRYMRKPRRDGERPFRKFERSDGPPRDRDDRPPRRFDRDDRPPRRFDRDDAPRPVQAEGSEGSTGADEQPPVATEGGEERPRRQYDDRPPRRFDREGGDRPPRRFGSNDDRPPRRFDREGGDRPPRRFGSSDDRPPRRFDREGGDRPPRRFGSNDDRPPRRFDREGGDRPPRRFGSSDDRPPRRFDREGGDRPPRRFGSSDDRPPRRFDREGGDRPPRRFGSSDDRPPRRFDREGGDRPPRRFGSSDDRPPRRFDREGGDRPPRRFGSSDDRPPRRFDREGGDRPPRRFGSNDDRPPRRFDREGGDRPPRRFGSNDDRPPRRFDREGGDRPPRKFGEGGDRPPRRFGSNDDRPPRRFDREGGDRPPRKFGEGGDRPPRRFGSNDNRPPRRFDREGGDRPPRKFGEGGDRPPRRFGSNDDRPPRRFDREGGDHPPRKPYEGAGDSRPPRSYKASGGKSAGAGFKRTPRPKKDT